MELHFNISGILLMSLAVVHGTFPKYFKWNQELSTLNLINRQMFMIHTLFIAITIFLMGLLCLLYKEQLLGTEFGKTIVLGLGIFWTIRLFVQFFGYSSELWKGKTFETVVHISFSVLWIYLSSVFLYSALT